MLIGIILDVNMVSWENPQKSRVFQGKILELIGECGAAKPRLNSKRGLIERLRTQLKKSLKWGYAIYTLVYNITCYMLPNQSLSWVILQVVGRFKPCWGKNVSTKQNIDVRQSATSCKTPVYLHNGNWRQLERIGRILLCFPQYLDLLFCEFRATINYFHNFHTNPHDWYLVGISIHVMQQQQPQLRFR